jgi:hypothetical protein
MVPGPRPRARNPVLLVIIALVAIIAGGIGAYVVTQPPPVPVPPTNCRPNAILVNPCRPWFGAVAGSKVAEFDYVERLIGRPLDIFRDYHKAPGSRSLGDPPLNGAEIALARRPHTYIDVNWKPASTFAQADGGNPGVNSEIARVAASIEAIAPHKIFLTIWQEPQQSVTSDPGHPSCLLSPSATGGTPAQYVAMWRNVERIFRAEGVSNVVWAMDFQAPPHGRYGCLVPQLWPGNKLVDWVLYDAYSRNGQGTWANTVGPFYRLLLRDSNAQANFDSKPWGLGEFGTCSNPDSAVAQKFYLEAKTALQHNTYPRLKMYLAYDQASGPDAGPACLSDYTAAGRYDPVKQADFNQFAHAVLSHR